MAEEEIAGQLAGKAARRLPLDLAELLTPQLEHALNHPLRRQILRTLNQSEAPRSATELAAASVPEMSVSLLNYHAGVLATCELVRVVENDPAEEAIARRYESTVTEDVQVIAVLGATEALDRAEV